MVQRYEPQRRRPGGATGGVDAATCGAVRQRKAVNIPEQRLEFRIRLHPGRSERSVQGVAMSDGGTGGEGPLVRRYGRTQRIVHWWIVATFLATFLDSPEDPDGITAAVVIHICTATSLLLGVLGVVVFGNRAALGADIRALLWFDATDRAFLRSLREPRGTRTPVRWGKFNTGQKAAAWTLLGLVCCVFLTGLGAATLDLGPVHKAALLLTYLVLAGHVFMAVVNPATRPALRGMLAGVVSRVWATKHHPAWVEQVDAGRRD